MFARDHATENKGTPMAKEYDGGDGSELRQGKRQEREEDTSVEAEFEKKGFGHGRGCGATGMGGVGRRAVKLVV